MTDRIRSRLTYANVVATLALFLGLGGGAYAVTAIDDNSVRSRHILDGEVKTADVGTGQIKTADLKNDAIQGDDIRDDTLPGGGLGLADIGPDAVSGSELAPNAVGSAEVAPDSLGGSDINEAGLAGLVDTSAGSVTLIRDSLKMGEAYSASDPNTFIDLGAWELRTSSTDNDADGLQLCHPVGLTFTQVAFVYTSGARQVLSFQGAGPLCQTLDTNGGGSTAAAADWEILIPGAGIWLRGASMATDVFDTTVYAFVP